MNGFAIGDLLRESLALYRRNARLVLAVTVPVVVVVTGVTALGLGDLTAHYRPAPPIRDSYISFAADQLVTVPLITAILARFVLATQRGERLEAADLLAGALEAFPAVLLVIVVWLVISGIGFVALIVPGIYFYVSWYFVVQAVVIDGDRGLMPLSRSATLVRGRWWKCAGVGLGFQVAALVPRFLVALVFEALASRANAYGVEVIGQAVIDALTLPFVAIGSTLFYLQLHDAAAPARSGPPPRRF